MKIIEVILEEELRVLPSNMPSLEESTTATIEEFLPFAKEHLSLTQLPTIKVVSRVPDADGTTFGRYDNVSSIVYLVVKGRHLKDVLRTLAHELVHYKQDQEDRLDINSGNTGSNEENEANARAGIIMRNYSEANPE